MQYSKTWLKIALIALPGLVLTAPEALAAKATHKVTKQRQGTFADGIAAVVNTDIITMKQLDSRMRAMEVSGNPVSKEEALSLLIDEHLMNSQAEQLGIRVTQERLRDVLNGIAQENGMTLEQLQQAAKQHGINWDDYVANMAEQVRMEDLRSQVVQSRVHVSEFDVKAFLAQHPTGMYPEYKKNVVSQPRYEKREVIERSFDPKAVAFQHIYIRVPEGASDEEVAAAKKKADEALAKIRRGASFASVARQYSDGAEAKNGGDLGIRMNEDWPELFMAVTKKVRDGGTTGVFKASNGFHILRVVERRGIVNEQRKVVNVRLPDPPQAQLTPREQAARHDGPVEVTDTHVRHILIRVTPVFSDAQAKAKIDDIYQKLQSGQQFADLAEKYSQDSSAPLGGDIGWVTPGQSDPAFEQAMASLQPGQVSAPVRSKFGWHILEVLDRRTEDKQASIRHDLAYETLYQEQAQHVLQDWLSQLRSQAYIDNRLTGQTNRK
ncbi:peptidylprolyl isomerase [Pelistega europaea]|uniref:Chaperone SurA n=1 Tax=Pelistega europaea TaxID=106147 RepID=A0A7Y4P6E0_9BURK|nr:peptidylprolyl isomerase [Pelistega europaea]NOL49829.1 peptidylprolyl isomerase [Pelistega europaea]